MSRLHTLSDGRTADFKRLLGEHLSAEDAEKLMKHPAVIAEMAKTMREQPVFRLIHGRFHSLEEKIEMVKTWPSIFDRFTEVDFTRAVEEARDSGLLGRFEAASPKNSLLNVDVSVYLGSVVEAFLYGRDRLRDAFGKKFVQWKDAYEMPDLDKRLRLLDGIKSMTNCIKIEVVDLGANWNYKNGFIPKEIRSEKSAHVQVLYAGAQDSDWVRQVNPVQGVPHVLMGGYMLTVTGRDDGVDLPDLWLSHGSGEVILGDNWCGRPCHTSSLPIIWK